MPTLQRRAVNIWLDKPDESALKRRAADSGKGLDEYVTDLVRRVAEVNPGRVPVVIDVDRTDYMELLAFVEDLCREEPDASPDEELLLHLCSAIAAMAQRSRTRGRL